jgi:hypothetical protein
VECDQVPSARTPPDSRPVGARPNRHVDVRGACPAPLPCRMRAAAWHERGSVRSRRAMSIYGDLYESRIHSIEAPEEPRTGVGGEPRRHLRTRSTQVFLFGKKPSQLRAGSILPSLASSCTRAQYSTTKFPPAPPHSLKRRAHGVVFERAGREEGEPTICASPRAQAHL